MKRLVLSTLVLILTFLWIYDTASTAKQKLNNGSYIEKLKCQPNGSLKDLNEKFLQKKKSTSVNANEEE